MLKNTPRADYPLQNFLYLRKIFHFAGIIFPFTWAMDPFTNYLPFLDSTRTILFSVLFLFFVFQIILEYLRFHFAFWQKFFVMTMGNLLKQNETERINGSLPYFFATLLLLLLAQREVAIVSMVFLIVGDPTAAYFGSRYGYWRFVNGKSIQGTMAGIIGAFLGGLFFLYMHSWRHSFLLFFSQVNVLLSLIILFMGAAIAFAFELVSGQGLMDDNLTIPLSSALAVSVLLALLIACGSLSLSLMGGGEQSLFFNPLDLFRFVP